MSELRTNRGRLIVLAVAGLLWALPAVLPASANDPRPPVPAGR
jgi:hypothetical protein